MKINTWKAVSELPEIPRGEMEECWVAVSFELRDHSKPHTKFSAHYLPAENKVLKLRWLNAELTTEEADLYEEEGELPETSPARLSDWTNEDGDHSNYTGWVDWIGGEEGYYRYVIPDGEGYISGGNWAGRFKILAWAPEERPEFPAEFSQSK
ncbi:hypothetical protein [Lelliottia wanjuensis]|uniref:hypothetical protein n=1 Tax=Lelliottia wanjuensis TaxID=3050585 RepID=UPI00254FDBE0|nr:hypothetical protein [Lelliottia sp. V104_15]MDK9607085.1 hypothetical protein [Lelliottia sp. V104_15]